MTARIIQLSPRRPRTTNINPRRLREVARHLGVDPSIVTETRDADLKDLITRHEAMRLRLVHDVREVRTPMTFHTPTPAGFTGFDDPGAA